MHVKVHVGLGVLCGFRFVCGRVVGIPRVAGIEAVDDCWVHRRISSVRPVCDQQVGGPLSAAHFHLRALKYANTLCDCGHCVAEFVVALPAASEAARDVERLSTVVAGGTCRCSWEQG